MATETLTAPAPVATIERRHSAEPSSSESYAPNRRRGNSMHTESVARQNKSTLPAVPENDQLIAEELKRQSQSQSRMSRAFTWSTNWNFAGESPRSPTFTGDQSTSLEERRFSKINRRLSSISSYANNVANFMTTDPSHETNFPKGIDFPAEGGFRVSVSIYGTVDALEATTMRLLMPQGSKHADFTGSKEYVSALEHICKLKNGDMLCRPTPEIERKCPGAAVILRGGMQDMVFKCFVVGTFPLALIFEDRGEMPPCYEMETVIF